MTLGRRMAVADIWLKHVSGAHVAGYCHEQNKWRQHAAYVLACCNAEPAIIWASHSILAQWSYRFPSMESRRQYQMPIDAGQRDGTGKVLTRSIGAAKLAKLIHDGTHPITPASSTRAHSTMANDSGRLIAIGDIHGCVHALEILLETIRPTSLDQLVLLGDLIDQGRDSCQVLNLVEQLRSSARWSSSKGTTKRCCSREDERKGVPLLGELRRRDDAQFVQIRWHARRDPRAALAILAECVPYYETPDFIFHARQLPARRPSDERAARAYINCGGRASIQAGSASALLSGKPVIVAVVPSSFKLRGSEFGVRGVH